MVGRRDERGQPDRLVEVGQVDDERPAEDLLRLGEGAVGDEGLAVAYADDLETALELASRIPAARLGGAVEVRPIRES